MSDTVLLIDGNNIIHRAFHALPLLTTSSGQPTNAAYGFVQMILQLLETEQPQQALLVMDPPSGGTFRDALYAEYKAQRPPMDQDLGVQYPIIFELAEAMGLSIIHVDGFEADDVIGTLAQHAATVQQKTLVVSGDKDNLQLIGPYTQVLMPLKGMSQTKLWDATTVLEEFGIAPEAIADMKGLAGDSSDNIPGVPKVGPKTATTLLQTFGTVENLYQHLDEVSSKTLRERLAEHKEIAFLSTDLATIRRDVPLPVEILQDVWDGLDIPRLRRLFGELEFSGLLGKLPLTKQAAEIIEVTEGDDAVASLCARAREVEAVGIALVLDGGTPVGLAVALDEDTVQVVSLPVASAIQEGLFASEAPRLPQCMGELLADNTVAKIGHDLKGMSRLLSSVDLELNGFGYDTAIAGYLLAPHRGDTSLNTLLAQYFGEALPENTGTPEAANTLAVITARACLKLCSRLTAALVIIDEYELFNEMEMPLAQVLRDMEAHGIGVDLQRLDEIGDELNGIMLDARRRVWLLANEEFNLDSPKQLGGILFEKLNLPHGRKTKTGWSTDAEVLEELAVEHEIVAHILRYREVSKLRSTYVEGLKKLVAEDKRVRTTFEQTVAATGRLSSRNPNLQNIPIRTEWGREVRSCFVAQGDNLLLSADYSQIELRIMAHLSQDPSLLEAFRNHEDIHTRTAAAIFDTGLEMITSDMRRVAKTINYAVIYGMGANALAKSLGIKRADASMFIENYFSRLPGVKAFMDGVVEGARRDGYVSTLYGRRRPMPDINSGDPRLRAYAERAAANAPLQGTAADIIKIAMVRLAKQLPEVSAGTKLLLQVHDDLVLESPRADVTRVAALVREVMESAATLDVPLVAEPKVGVNWRDMTPV